MLLVEGKREEVVYRIYGEYVFTKNVFYNAENKEEVKEMPVFSSAPSVVKVLDGKEEACNFTGKHSSMEKLSKYITCYILGGEAFDITLFVEEGLKKWMHSLMENVACTYNGKSVPRYTYWDGEIYSLVLCTDKSIFFVHEDDVLHFDWNMNLMVFGLIADYVLENTEERIKNGLQKLVWKI